MEEDEKKAKYLGRFAAALYLRAIYGLSISAETLAKKAVTGSGPVPEGRQVSSL